MDYIQNKKVPFKTELFVDMMAVINEMLPNIAIREVKYHLLKPEYSMLLMIDKDSQSRDISYESKNDEVRMFMPSGFLAGSLFNIHYSEKFVELIYLVVAPEFHRRVSILSDI